MKFGQHNPGANPEAIVTHGRARFTILTPAMIRMEWSPDGSFEDRATLAFINRDLEAPGFTSRTDGKTLTIETDELTLSFSDDGKAFHPGNLNITSNRATPSFTWTPGTKDTGNLRGTTRTLDGVSGSCPLEPGLLSRDGWTLVDDSASPVFNTDTNWAEERDRPRAQDWYFLGYGRDYPRLLSDYTQVAGRIPLPPRYVLGSWWSRYWAYTDEEFKAIVEDYRRHDVPLDVLVLDMDWHLDGWTGYTWNPRRFPEPQKFLEWCKEQNLHVTLNLHPADGVGRHEAMFLEFRDAMEIESSEVYRVPFDCTDPLFVKNYFELLHHPLEQDGVDFWWMDWQQGRKTKIKGLDPLWWLNHIHWTDMEQSEHRERLRPLIFSRWGGLGNHRYQVGFSGDTFNDWESLAFQPNFTATAGNVGYAYWSHDIGGHQPGPVEPELYARWIQYGIFSPILRTHAGNRKDAERRLWKFPDEIFRITREMYHWRYELLPYTYGACRQTFDTGLPLCRPLYYEWPDEDLAYEHDEQFLYGDDMMIAPVVEPMNESTHVAQPRIWIPEGSWTNWFTGQTFDGPCEVRMLVPLDEVPVFVRTGSIIPSGPRRHRTGSPHTDPLTLNIWPASESKGNLYEDDGLSSDYEENRCARTTFSAKREGEILHITIDPTEGQYEGIEEERTIHIKLHHHWSPKLVSVDGHMLEVSEDDTQPGWTYDTESLAAIIRLPRASIRESRSIEITLACDAIEDEPTSWGAKGIYRILRDAQTALAEQTPGAVLALLERFPRAANDFKKARSLRRDVETAWLETAGAIARADADPHVIEPLIARMLGVAGWLHLHREQEAGVRAQVETVITSPVPMDGSFDVHVDFHTPFHWKLSGVQGENARISTGELMHASAQIEPGDLPQTDVIRAALTITHGDITTRIHFSEHLAPSINAWWIVGPFDCPHDAELKPVFEPERSIDLGHAYKGKGGKRLSWQLVQREPGGDDHFRDEFYINFHDVFGEEHEDAVAYALTYIHAEEETDAIFAIGSDDGFVLWVNGEEAHRLHVERGYHSRQDRIPIHLKPGANSLLLKVGQAKLDWGFCAHLETPEGKPIPELRLTPHP